MMLEERISLRNNANSKRYSMWMDFLPQTPKGWFILIAIAAWNLLLFILAVVAISRSNDSESPSPPTPPTPPPLNQFITKTYVNTASLIPSIGQAVSLTNNGVALGAGTTVWLNAEPFDSVPGSGTLDEVNVVSLGSNFVVASWVQNHTGAMYARAGLVGFSNTEVVWGPAMVAVTNATSVTMTPFGLQGAGSVFAITSFILAYQGSSGGSVIVGTINVDTLHINFTQESVYSTGVSIDSEVVALSNSSFVVAFYDATNNWTPSVRAAYFDGTHFQWGSVSPYTTDADAMAHSLVGLTSISFLVLYYSGTNTSALTAQLGVISGSGSLPAVNVTFTESAVMPGAIPQYYFSSVRLDFGHIAVTYFDAAKDFALCAVLLDLTGNDIRFGSAVTINNGGVQKTWVPINTAWISPTSFAVAYVDYTNYNKVTINNIITTKYSSQLQVYGPAFVVSPANSVHFSLTWVAIAPIENGHLTLYSASAETNTKAVGTVITRIAGKPMGVMNNNPVNFQNAEVIMGGVATGYQKINPLIPGMKYFSDTDGNLHADTRNDSSVLYTEYLQYSDRLITLDALVGRAVDADTLLIQT